MNGANRTTQARWKYRVESPFGQKTQPTEGKEYMIRRFDEEEPGGASEMRRCDGN
jgi:hypothetical protein